MTYRARDFIETAEGCYFAVVENGTEDGIVLAYLRYVDRGRGPRKLSTQEAADFLEAHHPEYLYWSARRDVGLHGVPLGRVRRHLQPAVRATALMKERGDEIEARASLALSFLANGGVPLGLLGVTGSLLIGAHSDRSDIDLVIYDRAAFEVARKLIRAGTGKEGIEALGLPHWEEAYRRRGCALSFREYLWHEHRKHNKVVVGGTKVDIGLVVPGVPETETWRKVGMAEVITRVTDDARAFEHPARYRVDHPEVSEIVSYTPTFVGQAVLGEQIAARGWREISDSGSERLLVGTSREASGEFIRVVG